MKTRRIAVPALLALAACAVPASANAATLAPGKPCFGDGDPITLRRHRLHAERAGHRGRRRRPFAGALRSLRHRHHRGPPAARTATPGRGPSCPSSPPPTRANPANVGQATVTRARLRVTVTPGQRQPAQRPPLPRARGFTSGHHPLPPHHAREAGQQRPDGRPEGACRETSVRKRLFRKSAKSGTYRVQFDTQRRYSSEDRAARALPRPGVPDRAPRQPASAAAAHGEVWTQLR